LETFTKKHPEPSIFATTNGVDLLLSELKEMMGVIPLEETETAFTEYFHDMDRRKFTTLREYVDTEEFQYNKLANCFQQSNVVFALPNELRALMLLKRSSVPESDKPHLLMQTGGYDYEKRKEVIMISYSQRKKCTTSHTPWKPRTHPTWAVEEPLYNIDEEECTGDTEQYFEEEYNQEEFVLTIDELDYPYVDEEECIVCTDEQCGTWDNPLCEDDPDYEAYLIQYRDARNALANARVAR
jgi:hypothetical protein